MTSSLIIRKASPADFPALTGIWSRSVKATHDFLPEADFLTIQRALAELYFPAVELWLAEMAGEPVGFMGMADGKVEMLFVEPEVFGKGAGKMLFDHALARGATLVDVNEQNPRAVAFYLRQGFEVMARSPVDATGKPFPILHLRKKEGV